MSFFRYQKNKQRVCCALFFFFMLLRKRGRKRVQKLSKLILQSVLSSNLQWDWRFGSSFSYLAFWVKEMKERPNRFVLCKKKNAVTILHHFPRPPNQLIDSTLKYKKYLIIYILIQKFPILVFVKLSKYASWSYKWPVIVYIYMIIVHCVNNFFILFSLSSLCLTLFFFLSPHTVTVHGVKKMNILFE